MWKKTPAGDETYYFYGAGGQKLATYSVNSSPFSLVFQSENVYFGGKLIRADGVAVAQDRLGSVVARSGCGDCSAVATKDYFPYGDEIGTATAGNQDKFGTYHRDQTSGLDYADQRYFAGTLGGRFLSADPYAASGGASAPGSWNRYPYVGGDPVNQYDPSGLLACFFDASTNSDNCGNDFSGDPVGIGGVIQGPGCGFLAALAYASIPGPGCYAPAAIAALLNAAADDDRPPRNCGELIDQEYGGVKLPIVVMRILNENSYNALGQKSLTEDGSGSVVTLDSLFQEDLWIASAIYNRTRDRQFSGWGGADPEAQANQAGGRGTSAWGVGPARYAQSMVSPIGSNLCGNLINAVRAFNQVFFGSGPVNSNVRFWKGVA